TKLHAKPPADRFQRAQEVAGLLGEHFAPLQKPNMVARPPAVAAPVRAVGGLAQGPVIRGWGWVGARACLLLLARPLMTPSPMGRTNHLPGCHRGSREPGVRPVGIIGRDAPFRAAKLG